MTDDQAPKVFDMPHARVTLTPLDPGIEIEVWPKAGQSAYAVVDPTVAILIAKRLVEMAAVQLAELQVASAQTRTMPRALHADDTGDAMDDDDDAVDDQAPDADDDAAATPDATADEAPAAGAPSTRPAAQAARAADDAPDAPIDAPPTAPDAPDDTDEEPAPPSNVVDLASRRRPGR